MSNVRSIWVLGLLAFVMNVRALGQIPPQVADLDSLFGMNRVIEVHLQMELKEWAKMQPPKGTKMDGISVMRAFEDIINDAANKRHFRSEKSTRPGLAGYLGIDHQYGRANVTINGEPISGVGLRYKGNGTFLEGQEIDKLSYKIDFKEYNDELEFCGIKKLNLNNNVTDPSMLREALSYELFREAGIQCSRVGFAKVSITVPGKFKRKSRGLYTVVEQVDKRFLKDRYGSANGLLLKPSTFGVCRYFGDDWSDEYTTAYVPKTTPTPQQQDRVIEFARLLHLSDDATFDKQIDGILDVDHFLRFLAVHVLVCNLDSFLGITQNYYVYLDSESNKFQFIPWDMDHSFGAFPLVGTPETRRDLSIDHPGGKVHTLIERLLEISRYKMAYHEYLRTYMDTIFAENKVHQQISNAAEFLRPLISANGRDSQDRFEKIVTDDSQEGEPHALKYFVSERRKSVGKQLDGRSSGEILFTGKIPRFPFRAILGWIIALGFVLFLNFVGWFWGLVAGFRNSVEWGILNLFFYPVTPVIYGFGIRKDLGNRSAKWALFSVGCGVAWILGFILWIILQ